MQNPEFMEEGEEKERVRTASAGILLALMKAGYISSEIPNIVANALIRCIEIELEPLDPDEKMERINAFVIAMKHAIAVNTNVVSK